MVVPSKVFSILIMIMICNHALSQSKPELRKQGSVENENHRAINSDREMLASAADVCSIKNSISCNLVSNGTLCSRLNVISPQCNVSVYYTFTTCNMATQSNFAILRYTANIIHVEVSQGSLNGAVIAAASCKVFKQSHILNTCDMRTDFASLYVRGKTINGARCEDYLFHWANGLESRTKIPSMMPTKTPVVSPSKPSARPFTVAVKSPTSKPSIRPVTKASSKPAATSNRIPTRSPLASGQYYFSPTNQLITGSNICNVKSTVSCTLASNGTDCSKVIVQTSSCYLPVNYTFTACNLAAQTSFNISRYTAQVLHVDLSSSTFIGRVVPAGVCQMFRRGHNLNTCDMKTDFGSLYVNGKTPMGKFCGSYMFHWANGLESITDAPSIMPSIQPSPKPSAKRTTTPIAKPTARPSLKPTSKPSFKSSGSPSVKPTMRPSAKSTNKPSALPSAKPNANPSSKPTGKPSAVPSAKPNAKPSSKPTGKPSALPSAKPNAKPSSKPTRKPSALPSVKPTVRPSTKPTKKPIARPTSRPTSDPSSKPSWKPTAEPTAKPSAKPMANQTRRPSANRTKKPSIKPVALPSARPMATPTTSPLNKPIAQPTIRPIAKPPLSSKPSTKRQITKYPSKNPSRKSNKKTSY